MKRITALFSLVTVILWLMPLGAFIKPSQEKTACDGKRAFHMCSMMAQTSEKSDTVSITVPSGAGSGARSAVSGDDAALPDGFASLAFKKHKVFLFSHRSYYTSPSSEIFTPPKISSF